VKVKNKNKMCIKNNKSLFSILGFFLLGFFVVWGIVPAAKAVGGDWETVGPDEFVSTNGAGSSMALDPATDYPYVIFEDSDQNDAVVVKKFNGSGWETVGNVGFGGTSYNNIAFSPTSGEPYIAFTLNSLSDKVIIMRYTNSQWTVVGTTGFSSVDAYPLRLAIHPSSKNIYVKKRETYQMHFSDERLQRDGILPIDGYHTRNRRSDENERSADKIVYRI